MGGGLLPVTEHDGKIYFLLGREHDEKQWSDFGGGREGNESHYETALRDCLLYTSPSPRDLSTSRMPSSA